MVVTDFGAFLGHKKGFLQVLLDYLNPVIVQRDF